VQSSIDWEIQGFQCLYMLKEIGVKNADFFVDTKAYEAYDAVYSNEV
jgi:hypothetical protein